MSGVRMAAMAVAAVLTLGGCASSGFVVHRMPPQTPAADNAAAIEREQALAKARQQAADEAHAETPEAAPPLTAADAPSMMATYDPWERLNRFNYRFNAGFDETVFLPVSNAYRRLPSPVRTGAHNFFGNLTEIDSVINYTLQGRLGRGVRSLGRFVVNSTLGIAGLFDVAKSFHLPYAPTGFGTTLAKWGMHPGPYFVIPFLGPSTLRETIGLMGDYGTSYGINIANLYRGDASWGLGLGNAVDTRSNESFRYYSTGSPFEYEDVRFLYVRKLLLEDEGLHRKAPRKKPAPETPAGQ
jgi:phospholipid-binding lipoprotein MlaA